MAPRPAWLLFALVLGTLWCLLVTDGLVRPHVGVDVRGADRHGSTALVPDSVRDGGSVIYRMSDGTFHTLAIPAGTVALTFDDGPDPEWTPRILELLQRHRVPATFFVLGAHAAEHPGIIRDIRQAGGEIGVHTFSHPELESVSAARLRYELSQSQLSVAGATGEMSYLLRPPYSSTPSALEDTQLPLLGAVSAEGYVTALSDIDSRDWARPGVDAIVDAATPTGGRGGSILMHDGGGDRSQTVAALDRLIPRLQQQGYRFTTITQAVGLPTANPQAGAVTRTAGVALLVAVVVATRGVTALEWALLVVGVLVALRLLIMVVVAGRHRRRRNDPAWSWGPPVEEPVSVVVPAFNEHASIAATLRSIVAGGHPVEVVVVDDGSTDGSADLVESLALPNVRLLRQANAGKPAALNAGIAAARHDLVVMIDADTVLEPTTVRTLVQPFADPEVGAVSGNAKVANRTRLIARWQHIEYVVGFNIDRRVYDIWRCIPTVPGAVGAFRKRALLDAGGVSADTLAEDTDLTMAVIRAGWRVVFDEKARGWTEAPTTLAELWRQRYRWSYGTMQAMWKHRRAVLDRGPAGRFGRVGLLNMALFQIVLPLLAPLIDLFLVYGLLFRDPLPTVTAWLGVTALQLVAGVYAFRLEREPLRPLWLLPLQQIVYRQLMYAVLLQSAVTAYAGVRLRWQKIAHRGDFTAAPIPAVGAGGPRPTM